MVSVTLCLPAESKELTTNFCFAGTSLCLKGKEKLIVNKRIKKPIIDIILEGKDIILILKRLNIRQT
jgi:hypothetical protein